MAHRMGRNFARETYPERPRFASKLGPFATNGAVGPGPDTQAAPGGTIIPWIAVLSTLAPGTNVPFTAKSSRLAIASISVGLFNADASAHDVTVQILVNGVAQLPAAMTINIPAGTNDVLSYVTGLSFVVGVLSNVTVKVIGDALVNIVTANSVLTLVEVAEPG